MKCYKLELAGFNDAELRKELYELSEDCQQMTNRIWQVWECWHVKANSRKKIAAWVEAKRSGKEAGKWPVECFPKIPVKANKKGNDLTLRNQIEADLGETFPHVHARLRSLLANSVCKNISTTKAAKGSMRGWAAILLNRQSRPSSTRVLPIPFDRQNSKVIPGDGPDAKLFVRLWRDPGATRKVSEFTEFTLRTRGRAFDYTKPILRLATGEWCYKGSELFYDTRKKKWFALLACEIGPQPQVKPVHGKQLFLRCGYYHPVQVQTVHGEKSQRRFLHNFGNGDLVAEIRRQLLTQRWSRQANYRVAGSSNKGHGRERAIGPIFLLSRRWKDFVKRYNHTLTSRLVGVCLAEGIGELHFFQPSGGRCLDTAGKRQDRQDGTGWDYFQIKTLLAYKCEQHGIEFFAHAPDRKRGAIAS